MEFIIIVGCYLLTTLGTVESEVGVVISIIVLLIALEIYHTMDANKLTLQLN